MANDTASFAGKRPRSNRPSAWLLGLVVAVSAIFLAAAIFIYQRYEKALEEHYDHFGLLIASTIATGAVDRLHQADAGPVNLEAFTDHLLNISPDLASIEFYDPQGRLLYKRTSTRPADELGGPDRLRDFSAPIRTGAGYLSDTWGQVHVKLTGETMDQVATATKTLIVLVFVSAWTISMLAIALNTYLMGKHLRTLARGVQRISSGEFGYRLPADELWGELGTLAEAFNDMSVRLRAYEDQNLDTITFERNKIEAVLLSIADGVIVCDLSGEIIIVNTSACRMLDIRQPEVLVGSRLQDYTTINQDKCFEPVLNDFFAFAKGQVPTGGRPDIPQEDTVFSRQISLPEVTFKVMMSPIFDSEGQNLGAVMILHDVTREAAIDKLKTNFISNVSHELRTPVTTIQSYVDTLYNHGEELDRETYKEFFKTLHDETDRLKKMVNDILDFSRLESGNEALEKSWQDVGPIITLTAQSMRVLADQRQLTLSSAIEDNLPPVYINAESIERVMRNLLSNAIKYTAEGGKIRVRAEAVTDAETGQEAVEVRVHDTGIGIAPEHLPHLFDRFYRVENKVHTIKGTGLGLHLVKVAIEKYHSGSVFVESEVGQGSMFGFRLPVIAHDESNERAGTPAAEEAPVLASLLEDENAGSNEELIG